MISLPRCVSLIFCALLFFSAISLPAVEKGQDYNKLLSTAATQKGGQAGMNAFDTLVRSSSPAVLDALRAGALSQNARLRETVAEVLCERCDPEAGAILLSLLEDPSEEVRLQAIWASEKLRDPAVFNSLVARLSGNDPALRESAVGALAEYGARAVEPLLAMLANQDADTRGAAAKALTRIQDPLVVPALARLLSDADAHVRRNAVFALAWHGEAAVEPLLAALPTAAQETRSHILSALSRIDDPRAYPSLRAECSNADPEQRAAAVSRLSLRDPQAADLYFAALRDPEATVRKAALDQLAFVVCDAAAIEKLLPLLDDPDQELRLQGAKRLIAIRDPKLVDPLLAHLQRPGCPTAVIEGLGALRDPRAIPPLLSLLATPPEDDADGDFGYRDYADAASAALVNFGATAIEPLLTALRSEKPWLRARVISTLSWMSDARVHPALLDALHDADKSVRLAAIDGLALRGDVDRIEAMLPLLSDPDGKIRRAAARACFGSKDARLITPLARMLKSKDLQERFAAVSVLGEMDDPQVAPLMVKAFKDKDGDVRTAAGCSMGSWINAPAALDAYLTDNMLPYWRLESVDPAMALPRIITALKGRKFELASLLLPALRNAPSPEAMRVLTDGLAEASTCGEAADILADWHAAEAVPVAVNTMAALLQTDNKDRLQNLCSLSRLAGGAAVDLLTARLQQPVCSYERAMLISALGATGDARAIAPVLEAVRSNNRGVREAAIKALSDLNDHQTLPALLEALRDEDRRVRQTSLDALGQLKDPTAVEPLLDELARTDNSDDRKDIIRTLGEIGDPRAVEPLLSLLRPLPCPTTDQQIEFPIVTALGNMGDQHVAERLLPLLSACLYDRTDGDGIGIALTSALGSLHDERALDLLIPACQYERSYVAIKALGNIGGSHAAEVLVGMLPAIEAGVKTVKDDDRLYSFDVTPINPPSLEWQTSIGEALGQIKDDRQQQRLSDALHSATWRVRLGATVALGVTGEKWAEPLLATALKDPQPQVRDAAVKALARLQEKLSQ